MEVSQHTVLLSLQPAADYTFIISLKIMLMQIDRLTKQSYISYSVIQNIREIKYCFETIVLHSFRGQFTVPTWTLNRSKNTNEEEEKQQKCSSGCGTKNNANVVVVVEVVVVEVEVVVVVVGK